MKLKIHPLFFLSGLYFAITGKVFLFLSFFITAVIHEYGHAIALYKLGYKMKNISLMPYGAVINCNLDGLLYKDEILVAFSGPFLNIITALFFVALWWIFPALYGYTDTAVMCNLSIALLNFLPCYPLDGGRILSATLSLYMERKKAMKIVRILGIIGFIPLISLFIYSLIIKTPNFSILFFSLFILFGAIKKTRENAYVKMYNNRLSKSGKIRNIQKIYVGKNVILKDVLKKINGDSFFEISLEDKNGKTKNFSFRESEEIISSYLFYEKIEDIPKLLKTYKS